jgi:hypothetical protein
VTSAAPGHPYAFRLLFSQDFYALSPYSSTKNGTWLAHQFHDPKYDVGAVLVYRRQGTQTAEYRTGPLGGLTSSQAHYFRNSHTYVRAIPIRSGAEDPYVRAIPILSYPILSYPYPIRGLFTLIVSPTNGQKIFMNLGTAQKVEGLPAVRRSSEKIVEASRKKQCERKS